MKCSWRALAMILLLAMTLAEPLVADTSIRQEKVQFAKGASSAVIKGQLKGDATVDYVVRAAAGQTLSVKLQETNPQNYFNVMPPDSTGSAMFVGDTGEDYSGVLPVDGDYVVRVYLMRPAARRGESSNYTVTIGVSGKALAPIAASRTRSYRARRTTRRRRSNACRRSRRPRASVMRS